MTAQRPSFRGTILMHRARAMLRRYAWRMTSGPVLPALPHPAPDQPLRVGFVVCEPAKWGLGSLVARLQADPRFEVAFYPTLSDVGLRQDLQARRASYAKDRVFFAKIGSVEVDMYHSKSDRLWPEGVIDCDVVFVQQPWGMQDLPRLLSPRLRVAYVHYGMPVIRNDRMQFGLRDFHPFLWRHFVPTAAHAAAMDAEPGPRPPEVRVTGHPKFDAYLPPAPARDAVQTWPHAQDTARRRVIFAPHHGLEEGSLGLGTFGWSGAAMLDLARAHPQVDFLLRPHPNMAIGLARAGLMDAATWEEYKRCWSALPNAALFEGGGYFDTFRTSDAMITDSGSFLAEYLPTGAPLIRLERDGAAPLNAFGAQLEAGFYRVQDQAGLETVFRDVVLEEQDVLAEARAKAAALLIPFDRPAAEVIAEELLSLRNKG